MNATVKFVLLRLIGLAAVLLVASFLVYGLLYLVPGGPMSFLLGNRTATPEQIATVRAQYHLDDPFLVRYVRWLGDAFGGDLGRSLVYRQDVTALIATRIATTLWLVCYSSVLIVVGGLAAGSLAALRGGRTDALVSGVSSLFLATPVFVVGVVLVIVFARGLGWFPVFGAGEGFGGRLHHLTLPALTLAIGSAAYLARITRASVREEMGREHVDTARSRGLSESRIVRRHVLRNAAVPVTTVVGLTVAGLLAGAVVVENVFALDGIGSLLVRAIMQRDFAVVQAVVLVLVASFVVVNLVVDLLYSVLDPRMAR
ncbi:MULTISPECIES: ABC transporter permease [unclassified Streptomyces]|uniref:ABC transporter permease n=1 Tax=unclassified Streptomyces TaxID=2593676 RepID=UPI000DB9EC0B|nr:MULTISPECIES: ABC transporter permease [unclassified Streptomyces]MYT73475.1 ABC transporter permease subunit [Streptomyces sp. SID8367]RAJ85007.1 peptide/nickel transport system permease protein [Streptomyces sp. PsTaAH-137]